VSTGAPRASKPASARRKKRFSVVRFLTLLILLGGAFLSVLAYWGYKEFEKDLPERWSELTDYRPSRASRVFSAEGELIGEFYLQKRIVLSADQIPRHVKLAFIAAEDNRFFTHRGIDPLGILRAAFANMKAGRVVQGGSTITQQVAKLMLVGAERNLFRKIREAILSRKIEQRLDKEQILGIYLNHIYLGHGAYGVQAAAEIYFGKDARDLTVAEAAILAGLPKAPSDASPFNAFPRARERQRYVLSQMQENKFITGDELAQAVKEPIAIISRDTPLNHTAAPYFVEHVRKLVQARYGGRDLYDRGLRIHTTLLLSQQRAAEAALRRGLEDIERRFGFQGPVGRLEPAERDKFLAGLPRPYTTTGTLKVEAAMGALVLGKPYQAIYERAGGKKAFARIGALKVPLDDPDVQRIERWLQKRGNTLGLGDIIPVRIVRTEVKRGYGKRQTVELVETAQLAQKPEIQGALVAMDPHTGYVTALVGGYDYTQSQFNRATQARRQIGSSVKPYIYATALEHGFTEVSIVPDAPVTIRTAAGVWAPKNYKKEFLGPITLRTALMKSINTVSVRLVAAMGVDRVIDGIRRFGIGVPIVRHPSIALGTPEVTLLEHTAGYATFPAGGLEVTPVLVEKILDADGNVVEAHKPPPPRRRIPADTAYVMVDMMKAVVEKGTGTRAKELGRPAGGKTGTSNDFKDNWFMAFTRDIVCGVWVGRDDFKSIGHEATGGNTAAPIWTNFLKAAHPPTPVRDFDPPPGVLFVRATADRGLPAKPGTPGAILLPFKRGTLPPAFARSAAKAEFSDTVF
jgi:penicillin-binding protein 1A